VQLIPSSVRNDSTREILQPLELDLVGHCHGLPLPRKEHEKPTRIHAGEPKNPASYRIEAVKVEEEPAIDFHLREGLSKVVRIDHS